MPEVKLSIIKRAIKLIKTFHSTIEKHANAYEAHIMNDYYDLLESLQKIREDHGSFQNRLENLIKASIFKIEQIAKITDIPESTINDWLDGSIPSDFDAVERIAKFFEVSLSYLLVGKEHDE